MLDEMILEFERNNSNANENQIPDNKVKLFNCLVLKLPRNFSKMPDEKAEKRYSSQNRPEIIYTDITGSINFAFNLLCEKNINLTVYIIKIIDSIKMVYPNTLIYEIDNLPSDYPEQEIRFFEFRTSSLEGPIYNIMYLVSGKTTIMGTFNCLFEEYPNWKDIVFNTIKSIMFE